MISRKRKWRYKSVSRPKRIKHLRKVDDDIQKFVTWCKEVGISISKQVSLTRRGSRANIGMVARRPIAEGTCLAKIPRTAVLCCSNSKLHETIKCDNDLNTHLPNLTSWLPLILTLLYEQERKESYWRAYLDIVPNKESLSPPLLWMPEEREGLLAGTSVAEHVQADLDHMMQEYADHALPFMIRHSDLFSTKQQQLDQYSKMVAFVMSYSFSDTEQQSDLLRQTLMVPVIDLLNHHSNHHAELMFQQDHLLLTAIRNIRRGEEIMNTYGALSNASLVRMYGFAEHNNPNNTACIPVALIKQLSVEEAVQSSQATLKKRWSLIVDKYVCYYHSAYDIGHFHWSNQIFVYPMAQGIVDDDEYMEVSSDDLESFLLLVKMLHAPIGKIKPLLKLHSIDICDLTSSETSFISKVICRCIEELSISSVTGVTHDNCRQRVAEILRRGQKACLHSIQRKLESITLQ